MMVDDRLRADADHACQVQQQEPVDEQPQERRHAALDPHVVGVHGRGERPQDDVVDIVDDLPGLRVVRLALVLGRPAGVDHGADLALGGVARLLCREQHEAESDDRARHEGYGSEGNVEHSA